MLSAFHAKPARARHASPPPRRRSRSSRPARRTRSSSRRRRRYLRIPDADFAAAGARIGSAQEALGADLVLKVRAPTTDELPRLKSGAVLVGNLNPFDAAGMAAMAATGVSGFALESLPRISRAQSMDVLSSQANIAGYKAVMIAANEYAKFMPMLMTAAGTVKAARVLIWASEWRACRRSRPPSASAR